MNNQIISEAALLSKEDFLKTYKPVRSYISEDAKLFENYAFAEMFVRCYKEYCLHAKTFFYESQLHNNVCVCFKLHPTLADLFINEIDYNNNMQLSFAFTEIVPNFEKHALFLKTLIEKNPHHLKNHYKFALATSNHKAGCAYLVDEFFPLALQENQLLDSSFKLIEKIALKDSYFAIKILNILFAAGRHISRKIVMRIAVKTNEQFACYILNLEDPASTTWFPDYSRNYQLNNDYSLANGVQWAFGYQDLKEELYSLLCLACSSFLSFAERHVNSRNFDILLAVTQHPSLHTKIAHRKDLSNEVKVNLIRSRNNKQFASAFKDAFDIYVLKEVLNLVPELSDYILNERVNLSDKQKNWLRYESSKMKKLRDRQYQDGLHMNNRISRYDAAVKKRQFGGIYQ